MCSARRSGDLMARRPKIDALPPELKAQLERLLLDRTHGGYMALSAWLKEQGFEISHAAVHRYDQRMQNVMSRIKASTEAARLIAQSAPDEADEHSAAVLRMVRPVASLKAGLVFSMASPQPVTSASKSMIGFFFKSVASLAVERPNL